MGGTAAELFRDVRVGFPPLNQVLARRVIEDTAVYRHASSSGHPFNIRLLEEILAKFSQLVADFPEINEIDINPLIVDESSAVAVDARIVIDTGRIMREVAEHREPLAIASYPKKYVATQELKNGTKVLLRPIKSEDEGRFNALLKSLSEETMRFRFFALIKEMSHETLTQYCNLDYDREIAMVAELQQGGRQIIGAARVIVELGGKSGEFAVLVGDQWQGLGLGSMLTDCIISIARDMRLEKIYGYAIPNNYKIIQLCEKKGFKVETLDEDTVKVSLALS
jgi:acetyltransferase